MKAIKKLLLVASTIGILSGCEFVDDNPPSFNEFKEAAEWEIWDRGYEDLNYRSHEEQDEGWRYRFNYHASYKNQEYKLGVSCEADEEKEIRCRVTSTSLAY